MRLCKECGDELIIGENWTHSKAKKCDYICRGCVSVYNREYQWSNREEIAIQRGEYYQSNHEAIAAQHREYRQSNRRAISTRERERRHVDIQFKLQHSLRNRLRCALKNGHKSGSAVRDLGCTIFELIVHLEAQFTESMSWDNHGFYGWHIDHIIPLSSFDLTDREQLLQACHFTNLQPLWAVDNGRKGARV